MKTILATLAITLSIIPVAAYSGPSAFRQVPASGITITKTWINEHRYVDEAGVCASFMNTSPVTATRVEFLYSLIGTDGKVLHSTVHDAKGEFAPGALIQGESETTCDTAYGLAYNGGKVRVREGGGTFVASIAQVDFADGRWWHAGPDITGAVLAQPDAGVRIVKSFSWEPGGSTQECARFENHGAATVRHLRLMFSHIADDGSDIVDDPFDVNPALSPTASTVCRGWSGSMLPRVGTAPDAAQPEIRASGKPARLVAWIGQVDFTDGTSWHAPQPDPSALSSAAAPNSLDYSHAVWWSPHLDVAERFTQAVASGVEVSKAYAWAPGEAYECVDFVNRSPKAISHVRFTFSHLAADGSLLGEEPLDMRARHGSYDAGASQEKSCRTFDGNIVLPSLWQGGGTDATVVFQGQPSTINVRIDQVDYVDGTSWRAP